MKYHIEKPLKTFPADFDMDVYCVRMEELQDRNSIIYRRIMIDYTSALELLAKVYGAGSKEYKYIRRCEPLRPPIFKNVIRKTKKNWEVAIDKVAQTERDKDYRARRKALIERLESKGLVADEDFPVGSVITWWAKNVVEAEGDFYLVEGAVHV